MKCAFWQHWLTRAIDVSRKTSQRRTHSFGSLKKTDHGFSVPPRVGRTRRCQRWHSEPTGDWMSLVNMNNTLFNCGLLGLMLFLGSKNTYEPFGSFSREKRKAREWSKRSCCVGLIQIPVVCPTKILHDALLNQVSKAGFNFSAAPTASWSSQEGRWFRIMGGALHESKSYFLLVFSSASMKMYEKAFLSFSLC